jgi:hypothetical protein
VSTRALSTRSEPRIAVPAYFHPDWAGSAWVRLGAAGLSSGRVGLAVLNPASGVGAGPDDAYRAVCALARRCGLRVAGYVDTAYAGRPPSDVLAEAEAYRRWYGLAAIFLDQVTSGRGTLPYYESLTTALRARGMRYVAFNPGVVPDPAYADLADLLVSFEGPWRVYRDWQPPYRARRMPRHRVWHLVYDTPATERARAVGLAAARRAGYVYVTDRTLPNPWDGLPAYWTALAGSTACRDGAR